MTHPKKDMSIFTYTWTATGESNPTLTNVWQLFHVNYSSTYDESIFVFLQLFGLLCDLSDCLIELSTLFANILNYYASQVLV